MLEKLKLKGFREILAHNKSYHTEVNIPLGLCTYAYM